MFVRGWKERVWLLLNNGEGGGGASAGGGDGGSSAAVADSGSDGGDGSWHDDGDSLMAREPSAVGERGDDFIAALKALPDQSVPMKGAPVGAGQQPAAVGPTPAAAAGSQSAAPAAPTFSENHFAWGQRFGLTKEQVNSFGSPVHFEGWLRNTQQAMDQHAQRVAQQHIAQFRQQQQPAPGQQAGQQAGQNPPAGGFVPFTLPPLAAGEEYDPGIVALVKHQNDQLAAMHAQLTGIAPQFQAIGQLQQQVQAWHQDQRAQAQQHLNSQIDNLLGTKNEQLFGKGDWHQITEPQRQSRVQVSQALAILEAGYRGRGEALPPLQQVIDVAYRMTFGDQIRQEALQQAATQTKKLRAQTVAVPGSQRRAQAMSPDEEAARAIEEKMREFDRG